MRKATIQWTVWLLWVTTALGQVDVIVPGGVRKYSFGVAGFSGDATVAAVVTEVLKNDLRLSGHFQLVPAANAEYVQQGTVRVQGDTGYVDCTVILRSTQQVVLNKSYQGSAQDLRRMVHRLTDDIVQRVTGQRGIAQTRIAFVLGLKRPGREPIKELAVMDYDGHNVQRRTFDNSISVRPRWSPDGRRILYTSYKNGYPDVLEVDLFTGQRRRMAGFPGLNTGAVFSPDGSRIALTLSKDGNPELYVMDADGGQLRRLTRTRGAESSPTWSPDGQSIVYVSDDGGSPQLYWISRDGGEPRRLTVSPSYNTEPDWSRPPPGSGLKPMLALTSRVGGRFAIGIYDFEKGEVRHLVADNADNRDPSWAPNGRHLVFSKTSGGVSRLYLLDALTGEQIQLPAVDGDATEPAWSP